MATMKNFVLLGLLLLLITQITVSIPVEANSSISSGVQQFDCSTAEASIPSTAATVTIGGSNYYIGTDQVTGINQNPVLARFTGGSQDWCVDTYETTGVDGRGIGLLSTPAGNLYAYFTVDGGGSFNFGTSGGWLNSYGSGGGAKVSVISRIDTTNGAAVEGTFLRAELSNGNTNTLSVTQLQWDDTNQEVEVQAESFFSPLNTSGDRISVSGSSPFDYVVVLSADLTTANEAYLGTLAGGQGAGNVGGDGLIPTGSFQEYEGILKFTALLFFITTGAVLVSRKIRSEEAPTDTYDLT
jgi:hypothetical protein